MVIRRAVKLAHIVCAVFSLSRPRGVTRSQIYKFCRLNFHVRQDRRQFDRALERAEDEDLVVCFQQRYYLGAARGSDIVWSQKSPRKQRRKRRRAGAKSSRTWRRRGEEVRRARLRRTRGESSECSLCDPDKRRREGMRRRKCRRDENRMRCTEKNSLKGVILCESVDFCEKRGKQTSKRTITKRSRRTLNKREVKMVKLKRKKKTNVRSKREHTGKCACLKSKKRVQRKRKKSSSKKSCKKRSRRDVFREALRRPTRTVAHAESWDRINYSRRRMEFENQRLMKDSRLVQRILSARHGPSWDDLNKELRRIKSARSCEVLGDGQRPGRTRKNRV